METLAQAALDVVRDGPVEKDQVSTTGEEYIFADVIGTTIADDRISREIFSGSQHPDKDSQIQIPPYEPLEPKLPHLESQPTEPDPTEEVQDSEEEPNPPEPELGETQEKEWRAKAERFILDRYPKLVEFPELQQMFFRLRTIVYIVN